MTDAEIRQLVRTENNRYLREWRRKNPDKVSAINARYREKRAREKELENNAQNTTDNKIQ